jgi:hypothetical protein
MNSDGSEIDSLDVLIKIGILVCFVAFAICMWLLKRERDKQKKAGDQNARPPEKPGT